MLAKVAVAQGLLTQISSRHVGNILKKTSYTLTSQRIGWAPPVIPKDKRLESIRHSGVFNLQPDFREHSAP